MKENYESYYEFLGKEINRFKGRFDNFIFYLPSFFKLLCDLLKANIEKVDRMQIACALAYFVAPEDLIPEDVYGPAAYIDDIFLCCHVLNDIREKYGIELLESLWDCEEDLEEVLNYSYEHSLKIVEERKLKGEILRYIGLK